MDNSVIVLYHRAPYEEILKDGTVSYRTHGKPNGIIPLLKHYFLIRGRGVWIAASSLITEHNLPVRDELPIDETEKTIILRKVPVSRAETNEFYHKSSKEGFWPVLHSFPEKFNFSSINWEQFLMINQRFAAAACEEAGEEDIIWIHDYNLWMTPFFIRQQMPHVKIAFFFHTPFPAADIFNIVPWRKQILESILLCDMCNFDIPRYVENFVSVVSSNFKIDILSREPVAPHYSSYGLPMSEPFITKSIRYKNRVINLNAFPEGTNASLIEQRMASVTVQEKMQEINILNKDKRMIFAASRVDYIKGIVELLECFERLLLNDPHWKNETILYLIAVTPANGMTAYDYLMKQIFTIVGRINGKFSSSDHTPLRFITNPLSFEDMLAHMGVADIMWVTSLRDGMNIVCEEFIAAKKGKAGSLILSEFTGASVLFEEAILTNPYIEDNMDQALKIALEISEEEKTTQMRNLYQKIQVSDIYNWAAQLDIMENVFRHSISKSNKLIAVDNESILKEAS